MRVGGLERSAVLRTLPFRSLDRCVSVFAPLCPNPRFARTSNTRRTLSEMNNSSRRWTYGQRKNNKLA